MVRNFIFDFGKVLVNYDFMHVFHDFFPEGGAQLDEFCHILLDSAFIDRCDKEDVPFEEIIEEEKRRHPQLATQIQLFNDRFDEFILGEMEGMRSVLQQLKARGYRLYGLTNWSSKVHGVMKRYPIFTLLDGRIISSEEHLIKPDLAIYRRLCQKYSLRSEECLFADDKLVNVEAARQAGMQAVRFTTASQFVKDISPVVELTL